MHRRDFFKSAAAVAGLAFPQIAGAAPAETDNFKTRHVILILNGNGARKQEYYERPDVSPHIRKMADEGTVCVEDHNNTVSNHGYMFTELLSGQDFSLATPRWPTMPHYLRKQYGDGATNYFYLQGISYFRQWRFHTKYYCGHPDYGIDTRPMSLTVQNIFFEGNNKSPKQIVADQFPDMGASPQEVKRLEEFVEAHLKANDYTPSLERPFLSREPFMQESQALHMIPSILQAFKPRLIIFQQIGHDTGHGGGGFMLNDTGYRDYVRTAISTDEVTGHIYDFVKNDPYFSKNTAIIVRPETGRDDEVNMYGEINHSEGYYYCHRAASIWWGPDFKKGHVVKDVVNRLDMCKTIVKLLGGDAVHAKGSVNPFIFADHVGPLPPYQKETRTIGL